MGAFKENLQIYIGKCTLIRLKISAYKIIIYSILKGVLRVKSRYE